MSEITIIDNYEYNGERTDTAEFYEKHGFAIIPNAVPDESLDMYGERWDAEFDTPDNPNFTGWEDDKAYMHVPELKEVLCHKGVNNFFKEIDIAVALHVTKTRMTVQHTGWHLDATHPHDVGPKNYVGGMVALGDCNESNGAIEAIPGSHKWDLNYRERYSNPDRTTHPKSAEFETHRQEINAPIVQLHARRGDLQVWHGRSVHRAAQPTQNNVKRPAVVAHWCNRLVAESEVEKAGGHVPYEIMADDLITNKSNSNEHFFQRWGDDGGFYYPNCTITRTWLGRNFPEVPYDRVLWEDLPSYGIQHDMGDPDLLLPDGGGNY
jgi:hypothetical protein